MKNKSKITTITLILVLAISAILFALPSAVAQNTLETYPFINAVPNPVSVNQETLLHIGVSRPLILQPHGYEDLTVSVRKPNGDIETLGPYRTDSTGGTGTVYVPDQVGKYYLKTNFPAQWYNYTGDNGRGQFISFENYYEASSSEELELLVQSEPLTYYPEIPLPDEYWTRPIDAQLREWSTIAGSWLDGNRRNAAFAPYNDGPETAHILWSRPLTMGGLVGGALDNHLGLTQHSFDMGDAYEGKWSSRLIIAGKLYYNKYAGPSIGPVDIYREYACVDLHTGEELWSKVFMDNLTIAFGQLLYWDTYDFHGVYDYLWATVGSTWYAFDAFTGDWVYTMTDVPGGNRVYGPKGEILIYNVNPSGGWMTLWNSTNIPVLHDNPTSGTMGWGQWRPYGKTVNATGATPVTTGNPLGLNGYQWNVTIPHGLPGGAQWVYPLDRVIGSSGPFSFPNPITPAVDEITSWGIDLTPGQEGELLFNEPWDTPDSWVAGNQTIVFEAVSPESEDGVFVLGARDNRQHYGFSTETGEYLWVTDPEIYLNWYGVGGIGGERPPLIAYDKMFTSGVGGIVYAYSTITGERLWTYEAEDQYKEFLFNNNWWMYPLFITDGKIYYGHLEHSPIDPRPRGGPFVVLDVDDGNVVWRADGLFRQNLWGGLAIIGDSIIATMDTYDQRIYAIGKGPTKTTIVASPKVSGLGGGVLIEGMVTDESPGTKDYGLMARFPNGVPAVADESMSDWMLYVYKQFPHPTDTAGVSVTLNAVDSEGNIISIDTVTTDDSGMFKKMWTPQEEGEYIIIATFMGTESYYTSYAQTAIGVGPALSPDGGIEPETPAPSISTEVAIIAAVVVIAVIGIAIYWLIKKRE